MKTQPITGDDPLICRTYDSSQFTQSFQEYVGCSIAGQKAVFVFNIPVSGKVKGSSFVQAILVSGRKFYNSLPYDLQDEVTERDTIGLKFNIRKDTYEQDCKPYLGMDGCWYTDYTVKREMRLRTDLGDGKGNSIQFSRSRSYTPDTELILGKEGVYGDEPDIPFMQYEKKV